MPSGVDGGRKQPMRTPLPAAFSTAATASCGPGIGPTAPHRPARRRRTPRPAPRRPRGPARPGPARASITSQRGQRGTGRGRGEPGVVDERARPVDQVLAHRRDAEHGAALGAERLRQGGGRDDVGTPAEAGVGQQPAPAAPGDPEGVRLVGDEHGAVAPRTPRPAPRPVRRRRAPSRSSRPAPAPAVWRARRPAPRRPRRRRCAATTRDRRRGPAGRRRSARRGRGRRRRPGCRRRPARTRPRGWRGSRWRTPGRPGSR